MLISMIKANDFDKGFDFYNCEYPMDNFVSD
nr:hypothetical protein [Mucilaginibacter sp. SP1R1]